MFVWLAILLTLFACVQINGTGGTPPNENQSAQEEPMPLLDSGKIITIVGNRILVTEYIEKADGNSYIRAVSFRTDADTTVLDSDGNTMKLTALAPGNEVKVWSTGPIAASYPEQADAAKIVVSNETTEEGRHDLTRSEVIAAALAGAPAGLAPAVKSALKDEDQGFWTVALVNTETISDPTVLRIDISTGELLPDPIAQNDAFRVYAPKPGSTVEPGFIVSGEVRAFEATFQWTLEDGHWFIAEGFHTADEAGPAWGRFEFPIPYDHASQQDLLLILFIQSAKDGRMEHELIIPLKAPEEYIKYFAEE